METPKITKEELSKLSLSELRAAAKEVGCKNYILLKEEPLINKILERVGEMNSETQEDESSILDELKISVDEKVDSLIEDKDDKAYTELMEALGGKYEDDLDELLENVTEEQLNKALRVKPSPKKEIKEEAEPEIKVDKSKIKAKADKIKELKEKNSQSSSMAKTKKENSDLKTETLEFFSEDKNKTIQRSNKVKFTVSGKVIEGEILRIFKFKETGKEQCRIRAENNKIYFKCFNKIKLA